MLVRPGEITLEGEEDQPVVQRRQMLIPAIELFHGARAEILQHDIRAGHETMQDRLPRGTFQINGEAALVAIKAGKESRAKAAQPACAIPVGRQFHLDDIGAELGEEQPGGRAHHGVREF